VILDLLFGAPAARHNYRGFDIVDVPSQNLQFELDEHLLSRSSSTFSTDRCVAANGLLEPSYLRHKVVYRRGLRHVTAPCLGLTETVPLLAPLNCATNPRLARPIRRLLRRYDVEPILAIH
jgi:hypothetical protein